MNPPSGISTGEDTFVNRIALGCVFAFTSTVILYSSDSLLLSSLAATKISLLPGFEKLISQV